MRAGGLEPPQAKAQRIFLPTTTFVAARWAFVVWTIPSPFPAKRSLGAARLVSTPSRHRAWLGIAILQGSPNLSSSTSPVSPRALKSSSKSGASTDSATPASAGRYSRLWNRRQGRCAICVQFAKGGLLSALLRCGLNAAHVDRARIQHVFDV